MEERSMAEDEINTKVDELLAGLGSLNTRTERDALFEQVLKALPGGVAKPNRPGNEAQVATSTPTAAEIRRRWEADKLTWKPTP
jgi:hypothetical protein